MKLTALSLLFVVFLVSCEKDKVETNSTQNAADYAPLDFIINGNSAASNVQVTEYSTSIVFDYSVNTLLTHDIDINSDGVNDFQLNYYSYRPFAGTWYKGTSIKVKSLHEDAEVSTDPLYGDSTFPFANRYFENDTLFQQALWETDELFISINGDDPTDSCDAPGCPMISYGIWFDLIDQYIGIRMNGSYLGWIKISLPVTNPNLDQKIIIEEYACVS